MPARFTGVVAVIAVPDGAALARRLYDEGAAVVVTGTDGDEGGRLLAELRQGPGRAAFFASDDGVDALVEFLAEQFGERPPVN
jgi:NAD(P)-dependent dehydrogenase (short-subunit alcohol dehydrogenase family)